MLKEYINGLPDDWDVVLSKSLVIDKEEELFGIIDIPILGIAKHEDDSELRMILDLDSVKHLFKPDEIKPWNGEDE